MSLWNGKFLLIKPMLAFQGNLDNSNNLINEMKYDGTRCIAYIDNIEKRFWFLNRRMNFFENRYPEMKNIFDFVDGKKVILDGELVVFNNGKIDFSKLQEREQTSNLLRIDLLSSLYPSTYIVFDILYKDGNDLINKTLQERKEILEKTVSNSDIIKKIEYKIGNGNEVLNNAKEKGMEGIMQKEMNSIYVQERSKYWRKVKFVKSIDCIIIGYTLSKNNDRDIGALLLALYDKEKLFYIGKVGTGFSDIEINDLINRLSKIRVNDLDIENKDDIEDEHYFLVKPEIVCEVKFFEVTKDKKLRGPSFIRLRSDKYAKECELNQLEQIY